MESYLGIYSELKRELALLPRDYTRLIATRNWDVITDLLLNFNIGRFLVFMDNYDKRIPDKIIITKFGVDGPAVTAILYYDGNIVTYVVDGTRFQTNQFYYYSGSYIQAVKRYLDSGNDMVIDYNLITLDNKETTIIGIWAGMNKARNQFRL